nr:immunoglobulin heavy chain junction region [Mus musculus]MBK4196720.1 immunoglobulin heavy chain junction region [Mus musculus]
CARSAIYYGYDGREPFDYW